MSTSSLFRGFRSATILWLIGVFAVLMPTAPVHAGDCDSIQEEIRDLEKERRDLVDLWNKAKKDFENGLFCSDCKRSKTEIERQERKSFSSHLGERPGRHAVSATPQQIREKKQEFDKQIDRIDKRLAALKKALKDCQLEAQRRQQADLKRKQEEQEEKRKRRDEAERKQAALRAELEKRQRDATLARQAAEQAARDRAIAAENTRIMENAFAAAQQRMDAANAIAGAFQQIGSILQEKIERDAAREAEREAREAADRAEERAEQAAREERELRERIEERKELDDIHDEMYDDPKPFEIDPNTGLRKKDADAPEPPPVFPTPAKTGLPPSRFSGSGSDDGDAGSGSGGSSISSLLRAFDGDDDGSAGGRVGLDSDDTDPAPSSPSASSGSALRRLFGRRDQSSDASPAGEDQGSGGTQPTSALDRFAQRVRSGADKAQQDFEDAKRQVRDWAHRAREMLPENWRENLFIWAVTNQYERERNQRLFSPATGDRLERMGYVNDAGDLVVDYSDERIPIDARVNYYLFRGIGRLGGHDIPGAAKDLKNMTEHGVIQPIDQATRELEEQR
ncbi:MAG: hypothetical protein RLY21_1492 [Planctomycetota bacterium]|jgi:hypothetical protein